MNDLNNGQMILPTFKAFEEGRNHVKRSKLTTGDSSRKVQ
jgi:hypothetical protein